MKQLQFVKKTFKPVFRTVKWLGRFRSKRRYRQLPADSFSDVLPDTGLNINIMSFNIRRGTKQDGKNHWIFRRDLVNEILKDYSRMFWVCRKLWIFKFLKSTPCFPGMRWSI